MSDGLRLLLIAYAGVTTVSMIFVLGNLNRDEQAGARRIRQAVRTLEQRPAPETARGAGSANT